MNFSSKNTADGLNDMNDISLHLRSREGRIDLSQMKEIIRVAPNESGKGEHIEKLSRKVHLQQSIPEQQSAVTHQESIVNEEQKPNDHKDSIIKTQRTECTEEKDSPLTTPQNHKNRGPAEIHIADQEQKVSSLFKEQKISVSGDTLIPEKSEDVTTKETLLAISLEMSKKELATIRNALRKKIYIALTVPAIAQNTKTALSQKRHGKSITEVLKFVSTAAAIFLFTLGGLNFNAYSQIVDDWLHPEKRAMIAANLQEVVAEKPVFHRAKLLPMAGIERKVSPKLPSLNISVVPEKNYLVIPKIGKLVPIVNDVGMDALMAEDWNQLEESIQEGLRDGVVHYPGTALPGQKGNVFITGHSSYYPWDDGKYKDVFALLGKLEIGDTYTVYYDQEKYVYTIREKKVVSPKETDVLAQPSDKEISTLMTCWPVGTAQNRLIYVAERVE